MAGRKTDGRRKTGGRKKGTPNKLTASMKDAFRHAFDERGGVRALVAWAEENPTAFYQLVGRLIHSEVTGANSTPVRVETSGWRFGDRVIRFQR